MSETPVIKTPVDMGHVKIIENKKNYFILTVPIEAARRGNYPQSQMFSVHWNPNDNSLTYRPVISPKRIPKSKRRK